MSFFRDVFRVLGFFAAAACAPAIGRTPSASNSQSLTVSADGRTVYIVGTDDQTLFAHDLERDSTATLEIGARPSRITRVGDRLFATLRGERSIAVIDAPPKSALAVESKIMIGAEPFGIAALDSGSRVYATASSANLVVEIDVATLAVTRSWTVGDQPRWIALHPSGRSLYVASAFGGTLTWIDLESGAVSGIDTPSPPSLFGVAPATGSTRLTGDPAVTPDGHLLVVPGIYANNELVVQAAGMDPPVYLGAIEPIVFEIALGAHGEPAASRGEAFPLALAWQSGTVEPADPEPIGYPSSVTISPDGALGLITLEGASFVLTIGLQAEPFQRTSSGLSAGGTAPAGDGTYGSSGTLALPGARPGLTTDLNSAASGPWVGPAIVATRTDSGPRGITFVDQDTAYVDAFIDRDLDAFDARTARGAFSMNPATVAAAVRNLRAGAPIRIGPPLWDAIAERGRRLFYTANDGRASGQFSGMSCATCHFDGRNDGLTWPHDDGTRRKTPSLATELHTSGGTGWEGESPTVADASQSDSKRMFGALSAEDARAIEAYLALLPPADVEARGATDDQIALGKMLFERADVGCATCHSGARYSDESAHPMYGLTNVKTRALVGISLTPPYLHDGSALTLRDVLDRADEGPMGHTSQLSEDEKQALEAYLRTL
jgi:YVTN family beta-propeller protein